MKFGKKVAEVYDIWAPTYDTEANPAFVAEDDKAIALLDLQEGDTVLEIGCGTGRNLKKLLRKTKHVFGIDVSPNMLNRAKSAVPEATLFLANVEEGLPFQDEMFDKVLCGFVLSHIQNTERFFRIVASVMKKGGILVITTIHPDANFVDYEPVGERFRLMQYDINLQHSINTLITHCTDAGLEIKLIKEIMIEGLEAYFTKESYKKIVGTPFLLILKVRKKP